MTMNKVYYEIKTGPARQSVCPKTLGQPTDPKNGWIRLIFGTLFLGWISGDFYFWGPGDHFRGPNWPKTYGQLGWMSWV